MLPILQPILLTVNKIIMYLYNFIDRKIAKC